MRSLGIYAMVNNLFFIAHLSHSETGITAFGGLKKRGKGSSEVLTYARRTESQKKTIRDQAGCVVSKCNSTVTGLSCNEVRLEIYDIQNEVPMHFTIVPFRVHTRRSCRYTNCMHPCLPEHVPGNLSQLFRFPISYFGRHEVPCSSKL
ncbi:uncharacterized protein EI90DRAFT_3080582 [Cantharellus anzutake]|uniref:uncharacterized protein n=1 Tax=Cantharellus anzutake TaxID=1750568 RepID=UPI001903F028|nr:uncharacterized protein EI90DRAFT_3080582 [Cantharellus anzutake]KAF8320553.1 hypothetical protein EI90DRAFT_3080582 [Cantharellus anzutake]